jgi:hypothetical protein
MDGDNNNNFGQSYQAQGNQGQGNQGQGNQGQGNQIGSNVKSQRISMPGLAQTVLPSFNAESVMGMQFALKDNKNIFEIVNNVELKEYFNGVIFGIKNLKCDVCEGWGNCF